MPQFDLVFTGELIEGCDPAQVRRDLGRLFKTDATAISRLFTGKPVIIKKAIDQQTAIRYRAALQQAGALCQIRPVDEVTGSTTATGIARPADARDLENAAILPPGSMLTETRTVVQPPQFDLSGMSVAPPGATLVEQIQQTFAPPPGPGAFDVAPAGEDLVVPAPITPVPIPDISALTMAPPRTEILKPGEVVKSHPPPPDPGDLSLAEQ